MLLDFDLEIVGHALAYDLIASLRLHVYQLRTGMLLLMVLLLRGRRGLRCGSMLAAVNRAVKVWQFDPLSECFEVGAKRA